LEKFSSFKWAASCIRGGIKQGTETIEVLREGGIRRKKKGTSFQRQTDQAQISMACRLKSIDERDGY